jgi:hypothetical protein
MANLSCLSVCFQKNSARRRNLAALLLIIITMMTTEAMASRYESTDFVIQASLWTTHFNNKPYHNNEQRLLGIERLGENFITRPLQGRLVMLESATPLAGFTTFRNSFSQRTRYAYAGFRQSLIGNQDAHMYFKVTGGLMHGYRGEYRDKIPLNQFGTAAVAVPSIGFQFQRFNAETVVFGVAGVMLNVGYSF